MQGHPPRPTQLSDSDTGRWVVTTLTSRYLLDLDTHEMMRQPGGGNPSPLSVDIAPPLVAALRRDGSVVPLHSIAQCRTGESLVVFVDLRGDGILTVRESTQVVSIEPVA